MAGSLSYYGLVQNTTNMVKVDKVDIYMSYFLGAVVEIPCWSVPFIIAKAGRRWTLLVLFICSGLCCLSSGFIALPQVFNFLGKNFVNIWVILPQISIIVALIARMAANGAFNVCLQYSSEIFPTVIRGKGVRTPLHRFEIDNQNKIKQSFQR